MLKNNKLQKKSHSMILYLIDEDDCDRWNIVDNTYNRDAWWDLPGEKKIGLHIVTGHDHE